MYIYYIYIYICLSYHVADCLTSAACNVDIAHQVISLHDFMLAELVQGLSAFMKELYLTTPSWGSARGAWRDRSRSRHNGPPPPQPWGPEPSAGTGGRGMALGRGGGDIYM